MNGKHWLIFSVIIVAIFVGMFYMSGKNKLDTSDIDKEKTMSIFSAEDRNGQIGDHVFGDADSQATLIEYGDFQCYPGCKTFHENIEPILRDETYKNSFRFIYRHFPIPQSHPNAMAAAASAEAAGLQGKFWEMWDALFVNQAQWSSASVTERSTFFEQYASALGLNIDKFKEDMQSDAVNKKIKFDKTLGATAKVDATPTVFLNGKKLNGEELNSTQAIKESLDKVIKKNSEAK